MNISTSTTEIFLQELSSKSIKKVKVQSPNLDQIQQLRFHYRKPNHPQIVDVAGYSLRTILDWRNKTSEVKVEWVQQGNWYNPVRSSVDLPAGATDYGVITEAWGISSETPPSSQHPPLASPPTTSSVPLLPPKQPTPPSQIDLNPSPTPALNRTPPNRPFLPRGVPLLLLASLLGLAYRKRDSIRLWNTDFPATS